MIIVCKKCAARFESLIILPERAIQEITKKITTHWTTHHKEEMMELGKAFVNSQAALLWYLTMTNLCFVPEIETMLVSKVEESLDLVMRVLGYDESGDEIEDNEDNDNNDNNEDDEDADKNDPIDIANTLQPPPAETEQPVETISTPSLTLVAENKIDAA